MSRLESFANTNTETTGVFTLGDEKKHNVFMMVEVGCSLKECVVIEPEIVLTNHDCRVGPGTAKGHRRDRARQGRGQAEVNEGQFLICGQKDGEPGWAVQQRAVCS